MRQVAQDWFATKCPVGSLYVLMFGNDSTAAMLPCSRAEPTLCRAVHAQRAFLGSGWRSAGAALTPSGEAVIAQISRVRAPGNPGLKFTLRPIDTSVCEWRRHGRADAQRPLGQVATITSAAPQAISSAPVTWPNRWPPGMVFSRSTNTARPTIQYRFMMPP